MDSIVLQTITYCLSRLLIGYRSHLSVLYYCRAYLQLYSKLHSLYIIDNFVMTGFRNSLRFLSSGPHLMNSISTYIR